MVEYPRRAELVNYLELLSNRELQEKVWISHQFPEDVEYDSLIFAVLFFDDTNLSDAKLGRKQIGHLIQNEKEFLTILELTKTIDEVFDKVGVGKPDKDYMNHSLWDSVIQKAQRAYEVVTEANSS